MKARLLVAAAAVAVFLAQSPRAAAEFLSLKYTGNDGGTTNVTVKGTAYNNVNAGAFHWTDTNDPPNSNFPPPITTFCVDPTRELPANTPPTATFRVDTVAAALPNTVIPGQIDAIKALYGNYYNFATGQVRVDNNSPAGNREFQLALWEIVYDFNNLNVNTGNFISGASAQTNDAANALLSSNGLTGGLAKFNSSGYMLEGLIAPAGAGAKSQDNVQNQIIVVPASAVPVPPAALLAGIGMLALVGRARLTRRADPAA